MWALCGGWGEVFDNRRHGWKAGSRRGAAANLAGVADLAIVDLAIAGVVGLATVDLAIAGPGGAARYADIADLAIAGPGGAARYAFVAVRVAYGRFADFQNGSQVLGIRPSPHHRLY